MSNPLLIQTDFPKFSQIQPSQVASAIDDILTDNRTKIKALLERNHGYTWKNLIEPLESLQDRLNQAWSQVAHLNAVVQTEALREVYNACLPKLSEYATELGQNEPLYHAFKEIADSAEYQRFTVGQKKLIKDELRDFKLAGVALPEADKKRFREIQQQLSQLAAKFENNLLDATDGWSKLVVNETELAGMPEHTIATAKETAQRQGKEGWLLTLEFPCYHAVISHADSRSLREEVYTAYVTRASDQGPHAGKWDNSNMMVDILKLRYEEARLLGFNNYAELSLATKMAKKPQQVMDFLHDLVKRSQTMARRELTELQQFAKEQCGIDVLQAWDIPYCSEKLQQHRYALSQEDLRPYFPEKKVLEGMFAVVKNLYGMQIVERTGVDTWHKDVRFFEIRDQQQQLRGHFYLDLYARPQKRGGAWMDECRVRRLKEENVLQTPIAFLTCNFSGPSGDRPALFTHDEVITLFHEFGHGLHHLLTKVDYAGISGINGVPWDAVELPSQFMENWCWERPVLNLISSHYQTGEVLPESMLKKMLAAKNFQAGMYMLRQLEFSLFDFRLHYEYDPKRGAEIQRLLDEVRTAVSVVPVPPFNRFQHGFSHIFAGGYAAGYYSYKWAEVLSSDAFAKFEETGLLNPETGKAFLENILEQGGTRDPMELFVAFRGREPVIDALLRHSGITAEPA